MALKNVKVLKQPTLGDEVIVTADDPEKSVRVIAQIQRRTIDDMMRGCPTNFEKIKYVEDRLEDIRLIMERKYSQASVISPGRECYCIDIDE